VTAFLSVTRPVNGLIAAASVILGYALCPAGIPFYASPDLWCAALSAFFISGFGNVINDILDLEIDALNRPGRPLPSGRLTPAAARRFAILLLLIGLVLARVVSLEFLVMAFMVACLLFAYNTRLKSTVLWGNIIVAFTAGFTLIYGALLARDPRAAVVPALFAFLINLVREIVKDMEDVEGDRRNGIITLPVRAGHRTASLIAVFIIGLLVLFTYYPVIAGFYSRPYLFLVTLAVNLPLAAVAFFLLNGSNDKAVLGRLSAALKWIMLAGFASIIAGNGGFLFGFAFGG
jgi:geranylgeranylglycerol-phosphate geranylgeranyltransferase